MRIRYSIATYNLGDLNTEADNEAYAAAVATRIEERYPAAIVEVDLLGAGDRDGLSVLGPGAAAAFDEIDEVCREIAQNVWDAADYGAAS